MIRHLDWLLLLKQCVLTAFSNNLKKMLIIYSVDCFTVDVMFASIYMCSFLARIVAASL